MPNDDKPQTSGLFRRVVARSIRSPWNVSVAGASAAVAVALHSWPLFALGGAAYAALVAWDLVSPDFWKKAVGGSANSARGAPGRRVDPKRLRDGSLRQMALRIERARADLARLFRESSADVGAQLASVSVSVDELDERASGLLTLGDQLVAYLAGSDVDAVRREMEVLKTRGETTGDPEARAQYEATIQARKEQLAAITDIASAVERIYANLSRIVATLEGLSAKVVRMGAMDAEAMGNLSGDMNAELEKMNLDITTFEETLRQLVAADVHA